MDEKEGNAISPGTLTIPENSTSAHKRSSSDAGISYHVRPHRRGRRKDIGFQIIDQQGVADGRSKNIQSVLVSIGHLKRRLPFKKGKKVYQ